MAKKKTAAEKKAAVLGTDKKGSKLMPILIGAGVLALVLVVGLLTMGPGQKESVVAESAPAKSGADFVSYPVKMFSDGKARHFEYAVNDKLKIRYFILKSSDGIIRAAFDACDVCWPSNKGYAQDGDVMVCRNCGRRFASVRINEIKGGCNPAPLNRKVEGETLIITLKDIMSGSGFFDFSKRG